MSYDLYDRVLGCLLARAWATGIGAPTEGLSQDEIAAEYGKAVETFEDGLQNFYSLGNDVAEVTDDASQMYEMAKETVSCGGVMTPQAAARAVVRWSESYPKYYPRNAGPTTSLVIEDLKNGADPIAAGMQGRRYGRGTSNGASMRVAAAGLTAVGDREKAIANAVAMSRPTHGTQHAFSGACAIACGVTEALKEDADVLSIVQACLYGARRGEEIGLATARRASGCSTVRCIERAGCRRAAARGYALGTRRHRIRGRKRRCHSGERRRGNRHFHGGARRCGKDHPRRGEHRRRHRHHRLHGGDACGRIPGHGVHSS